MLCTFLCKAAQQNLQYHAVEKRAKKIPLLNELSVQTREVFSCMKLMWESRIQYHFRITRLSESPETLDI